MKTGQKKKVLFIDRDGTLIKEPADEQIDSFEKLLFYPGVFAFLSKIAKELSYELVMITNQDGLGTSSYPEDTFWPVHNFIMTAMEQEGIYFNKVLIDKTYPHENAVTRKPQTGLLTEYFSEEYDLANSYVIGDRLTDIELANNLGAKGIFIQNYAGLGNDEITVDQKEVRSWIALETDSWEVIYQYLLNENRRAMRSRNTKETQIEIELNLDGTGVSNISTGLAFFDHMLDQLARHGQLDLDIKVKGDLEVDEHQTIEDTA
ncbi:histidinol-phosphatase, partial [Muriicola sp.]|uniref:histidinol-phosphatase n=1 Tax=Muriicola sp. TaxID=2020856 RepID=UPI003C749210